MPPLSHHLLAVDPSIHRTGLALWVDGVHSTWTVRVPDSITNEAARDRAATEARDWVECHLAQFRAPRVAVVEDPYLPPMARTSHAAMKAMAYMDGGWTFLLRAYGWRVVHVTPNVWKRYWRAPTQGNRKQKAAHLRLMAERGGLCPEGLPQDEVDAALIGAWWRLTETDIPD